jgi:hypothetical protein
MCESDGLSSARAAHTCDDGHVRQAGIVKRAPNELDEGYPLLW